MRHRASGPWIERGLRLAALLALAAAAGAAAAQGTSDIESLKWLAGHWIERRDGGDVEEVWLAPKGGLMLAMSRTVRTRGTDFEFLRIAVADGRLTLFASPRSRPPVPFAVAEIGAQRVVFENAHHDFPRRIEYRREGDVLFARIEGPGRDGRTHALQWRFLRASAP